MIRRRKFCVVSGPNATQTRRAWGSYPPAQRGRAVRLRTDFDYGKSAWVRTRTACTNTPSTHGAGTHRGAGAAIAYWTHGHYRHYRQSRGRWSNRKSGREQLKKITNKPASVNIVPGLVWMFLAFYLRFIGCVDWLFPSQIKTAALSSPR